MTGMFTELKKLDKETKINGPGEPVVEKNAALIPLHSPKIIEEKSNCQLNAWITTNQDQLLNSTYYRLRANRIKVKKGELIGVAIEIISRILENQFPAHLDASVLDSYLNEYEKTK